MTHQHTRPKGSRDKLSEQILRGANVTVCVLVRALTIRDMYLVTAFRQKTQYSATPCGGTKPESNTPPELPQVTSMYLHSVSLTEM